jgi:DNA-binding transcriptional ArsR family regulator
MALPDPSLKFPEIDRIIHEPARLAILTVLSGCGAADFLFLENATGLSRGNLSVQLTKLEEVGLLRIRKEIVGKKTRTTASLTVQGAKDIAAYWKTMDKLRAYDPRQYPGRVRHVVPLRGTCT